MKCWQDLTVSDHVPLVVHDCSQMQIGSLGLILAVELFLSIVEDGILISKSFRHTSPPIPLAAHARPTWSTYLSTIACVKLLAWTRTSCPTRAR
jgi:hypothetical protein